MRRLAMLISACAASALAVPQTAEAATLIVNAGKLVGATGVDVLGTLYDVSFVDGTCAQVFDNCDDAADFQFSTDESALAAAQALIDQVFIDSAAGSFDSNPDLVLGCENVVFCSAIIPIMVDGPPNNPIVKAAGATNVFNAQPGETLVFTFGAGFNSFDTPQNVYAKFSAANPSAVPEPSTWAMLVFGFGLVGAMLRGRRNRQAFA